MSRLAILALAALPAVVLADDPVSFRRDVVAALSRAGCSQGACHGSPQGKNGFRLSLRGFDPDLDYATLVREQGGRRVDRVNPEASLILLKGSGRMPHQGAVAMSRADVSYKTVLRWILEGCRDLPAPPLTRLEVLPGGGKLDTPERRLTARAHFKDGSSREVSDLAVFTSSEPALAPVTKDGRVRFMKTGEASVLVRYLDRITGVRLTYVERDPN